MDKEPSRSLASRICELERQCKRQRAYALATTLGLLVLVIAGASQAVGPRVVDATRVVVRDADGKIRGDLGVRDDGSVSLALNDPEGRKRLGMSVLPDDFVGMGLYDKDGGMLVEVRASGAAGSGLAIRDKDLTNRINLGAFPNGEATLNIKDKGENGEEEFRASLGVTAKGTSVLLLDAKGQKDGLRMSSGPPGAGGGAKIIVTEDGKAIVQIPH